VGSAQTPTINDQNADSTDSPTPTRALAVPHHRRRNYEILGLQPRRRLITIVEPLARASQPRYGGQLGGARELPSPLLLAHMPGDQGFEPIEIGRYSRAERLRFCLS